jgi:hypothetical protein
VLRKHLFLIGLIFAWLTTVGAGQFWLWSYQTAPGAQAPAPGAWPSGSALWPAPGSFTLVLFAHPHCPCTRASLEELSWILSRSQEKLDAYVVFVKPEGAVEGWERTANWDRATAIPGSRIICDADGREAVLFCAETSGQALLYSPDRRLFFRGGLTAQRGHPGDNPGRRAILAFLAGASPGISESPVFGCPLLDLPSSSR